MDQHTSEENKRQIEYFRRKYPKTNALQGVMRLDLSLAEAAAIISRYTLAEAYAITLESNDDEDEHIHFVVYNSKRKIPITGFREHIKRCLPENKIPKEYKNGMLNITRVEDSFRILCYIMKEQLYDSKSTFIVHALTITQIKLAIFLSYKKVKNWSTVTLNLLKDVRNKALTPLEATVEYVWLRNNACQPDPRWQTFYKNCKMMVYTDKVQITNLIQEYEFEF